MKKNLPIIFCPAFRGFDLNSDCITRSIAYTNTFTPIRTLVAFIGLTYEYPSFMELLTKPTRAFLSIALVVASVSTVCATGEADSAKVHDVSKVIIKTLNAAVPAGTTFTEVVSLPGVIYGGMEWGDYDNDNDLDVVITGNQSDPNSPTGFTRIYKNNGGVFTEDTNNTLLQLASGSVDWADYDRDGDIDLLLTGYLPAEPTRPTTLVYTNANGVLSELPNVAIPGVSRGSCHWVDWDNDGDLDIFITGWTNVAENTVSYIAKFYRNNNSAFEAFQYNVQSAHYGDVAWNDVDGDRDFDLLVTGGVDYTNIWLNNVEDPFSSTGSLEGLSSSSAAWGDFDNDGDQDLIISGTKNNSNVGSVILYKNSSAGLVSAGASGLTAHYESSMSTGDYDNDGDLDVLLTGFTSPGSPTNTSLFNNNGTGNFTLASATGLTTPVRNGESTWGDFDNDGDLDLIVCGSNVTWDVRYTRIYRNDLNTTNTAPGTPTGLASSQTGSEVIFSWNAVTDPQGGTVSYNLRIGTTPGGSEIMSASSDLATGYHRIAKPGNVKNGLSWRVKNLTAGTYYWSVQAIDNSYKAGSFSSARSFTISENYYISHSTVEPWNNNSNRDAMTTAFGSDNWVRLKFNDPNMATIFTSETHFIFIDGSAGVNTNEMTTFFSNHRTALENWVAAGGRLLLNGGPDLPKNLGFGSLSNKTYFDNDGWPVTVVGPLLSQPFDLTDQTAYSGSFSHAKVSGDSLRPLILGNSRDAVILADKPYGDGFLVFGGMTTNNFHTPQPQGRQLLVNILHHAANSDIAPAAPEANFIATELNPVVNNRVTLIDISSGYSADRTWEISPATFEYADGSDEHSSKPVIRFREAGQYSVTLTVSNELGQDSETKENYITVQNRKNFYWVGGGGYWESTEHWATSSGGNEFHEDEPTKDDNVIFDENSFSAHGQEVVLGEDFNVFNFTVSGTTHEPEFTDGGSLKIYGGITVSSPATFKIEDLELKAEERVTIDLTDATLGFDTGIEVDGPGTFDFVSPVLARYFYPEDGNLYTHGHTITVNEFGAEGGTAAIWFQNSELHARETFYMWSDNPPFKDNVNLFLGSSNSTAYFNLQEGLELNEVTMTGKIFVSDDMPAKKITFMPGANVNLEENKLTAETYHIKGTEDESVTIAEGVFSKASGTVVAEYVQLTNVIAEGGANFYADKHSVDNGGNTGWIFSTKEAQHITFAEISDVVYGAAFNLTATSSSGLAVAYTVVSGPAAISGNILTTTGPGEVTVQVSQNGDDTYLAAQDVIQSFTVVKAEQNLSFTVGSLTFGQAPVAINTTPGESGNDVTYSVVSGPATISGNVITITGAGTVVVKADQEGNDNYLAASVSKEISIAKGAQTIVFPTVPAKTFGDAAFSISATGGASDNPVVFSVTSGPATLAGNIVILTGAGPVTIEAFQSGNDNYADAISEQTFCVNPAKPTVTVADLDTETPVLTSTAGEGYQWFNNGAVINGAQGKTYTATEAGIYTVAINASNCVSVSSDAHVFIVTGIEGRPETFLKAYPNPVMNELVVDMTSVHSRKEISVALYDAQGRLMTSANGKGTVSIPMQSYHSGHYAVVVHFDMQRITRHIIKK